MAVYCSRCNTANREGSRFCNSCGAQLEAPPSILCPNCQTPSVAYSTFCHRCGARLPQPEIPVINPPEPITETDEEGEPEAESNIVSLDQVPPAAIPPGREPVALDEARAAAMAAAATAEPESAEQPSAQVQAQKATQAEDAVAPAAAESTVAVAGAAQAAQPAGEPPIQAAPAEAAAQAVPPAPLVRVRPSPGRPVAPLGQQPVSNAAQWGRRLAYLILAIAVAGGLFLPSGWLGNSAPAAPEVQNLYTAIESLPERALVLVSFDYDPATSDEMRPLAHAVVQHLMQRKARLLIMSLLPQGPALAQGVVQPLAERNVYSYGADYVNLGYLPGDDAALAALGDNLGQAFASDFVYGRPLAGFAIAKDVGGVDSVSLAVDIAGDDAPVRRWVEQVQARRQTRLAAATSAVAMPLVFPYLQSGQVLGLASGLPAAAQYEYLLSYTGQATRGLEAQSLGHLVILALIIIANVRLLFRRR